MYGAIMYDPARSSSLPDIADYLSVLLKFSCKPWPTQNEWFLLSLTQRFSSSLAHNIGLSPILAFQDVYSITDPDLLLFAPPSYGVSRCCFPSRKSYEEYRKHQDEINLINPKGAHWFKQTVANGCGFYAILHIPANFLVIW